MNSSDNPEGSRDAPENQPDPGIDNKKGMQPRDHREVGGPPGPEPTRYGDWEKNGRCIDF